MMNGFQLGGKKLKVQLKRDNNKHNKLYWQRNWYSCMPTRSGKSVHMCRTIDRSSVSSGLHHVSLVGACVSSFNWHSWKLLNCVFRRSIVVASVPLYIRHLIHSIAPFFPTHGSLLVRTLLNFRVRLTSTHSLRFCLVWSNDFLKYCETTLYVRKERIRLQCLSKIHWMHLVVVQIGGGIFSNCAPRFLDELLCSTSMPC
jgi:hypothetical protein